MDLNCDLGEGEHPDLTRGLMQQITSANVACGGHAGNRQSMAHCVRLAGELGVRLGAHPGPPSRDDFGRGAIQPTVEELSRWVFEQAGSLQDMARQHGLQLHHIKLHGALYHASEAGPMLAQAYVDTVRRHFPGVKIYSRSGGQVARMAREIGIEVLEEIFADRAYLPTGQLVPRHVADALLTQSDQVVARLKRWLETGQMETVDGGSLALAGQTLCVHGDTPHASALIRAIRDSLI